ncbi:MAG: hypothetical protein H9917_11885 [Candidatus Oceanisphaera merdipullorum]|nr:hypothetical protein [Candidatus Oceanisphaera merdipullorum]
MTHDKDIHVHLTFRRTHFFNGGHHTPATGWAQGAGSRFAVRLYATEGQAPEMIAKNRPNALQKKFIKAAKII